MAPNGAGKGAKSAAAIRQAGLRLIYQHGYEGFGLRALADAVGLRPASLYNHFASKQALLFEIIFAHMEQLIGDTGRCLAVAGGGPIEQLQAFTAHHLAYHIDKKREVYVANFELRALTAENHAVILARRKHYEGMLIGILQAGRRAGLIEPADPHVAAYALLAMLTGACTWYKPQGRLSKDQMIALHGRLVLRGWCRTETAAPDRAAA